MRLKESEVLANGNVRLTITETIGSKKNVLLLTIVAPCVLPPVGSRVEYLPLDGVVWFVKNRHRMGYKLNVRDKLLTENW